jgi:hypothetical protein
MCAGGGTGSSIGSSEASGAGNPTDDEVAPDAPLGSGVALDAGGGVDEGVVVSRAGAGDVGFKGAAERGGVAVGGATCGGAAGAACAKACAVAKNVNEPARRSGAWRMGPIVGCELGTEARR